MRPSCSNCRQRHCATSCSYDEAPRRRGPDRKPGRIRGPSGSSASLEKKKQVRKQTRRESGTDVRKASSSHSPVSLEILPVVAAQQEFHTDLYQPPESLSLTDPIAFQTQELKSSFQLTASAACSASASVPVSISRIFTTPKDATEFSAEHASPEDHQSWRHPAADERQRSSAMSKDELAETTSSFADSRPAPRPCNAENPYAQSEPRRRSRPSLTDLLLPSIKHHSIPSASSYFPSPSSSSTGSHQSYSLYRQDPPDFSFQSSYASATGMAGPRQVYWVQVFPPSGNMQPSSPQWVMYDEEQVCPHDEASSTRSVLNCVT